MALFEEFSGNPFSGGGRSSTAEDEHEGNPFAQVADTSSREQQPRLELADLSELSPLKSTDVVGVGGGVVCVCRVFEKDSYVLIVYVYRVNSKRRLKLSGRPAKVFVCESRALVCYEQSTAVLVDLSTNSDLSVVSKIELPSEIAAAELTPDVGVLACENGAVYALDEANRLVLLCDVSDHLPSIDFVATVERESKRYAFLASFAQGGSCFASVRLDDKAVRRSDPNELANEDGFVFSACKTPDGECCLLVRIGDETATVFRRISAWTHKVREIFVSSVKEDDCSMLGAFQTHQHSVIAYADRIRLCDKRDSSRVSDVVKLRTDNILNLLPNYDVDSALALTLRGFVRIKVENDDADVWRWALSRGIEFKSLRDLDIALSCAPKREIPKVRTARARLLCQSGAYVEAARDFFESDATFEHALLKLKNRAGRREYLNAVLETTPRSRAAKRALLLALLLDTFASDDDTDESRSQRRDAMMDFLTIHKLELNQRGVREMLVDVLDAASVSAALSTLGRKERLFSDLVENDRIDDAMEVLKTLPDLSFAAAFCGRLAAVVPHKFSDELLRRYDVEKDDEILKLVDCLGPIHRKRVVSRLVDRGCARAKELLAELVWDAPEEEVVDLVRTDRIDPKALLRATPQGKVSLATSLAAVKSGVPIEHQISLVMECESVPLTTKFEICHEISPNDPSVEIKETWRRLLKQRSELFLFDPKEISQYTRNAINVEDLLPHAFERLLLSEDPEKDSENLKTQLLDALSLYDSKVNALREEMDKLTEAADSAREDLARAQRGFETVRASDQCDVCFKPLLSRADFIVFPCTHAFHSACVHGETDLCALCDDVSAVSAPLPSAR